MLKWTARTFALAAALQFGLASAQDAAADVDAELIPPGPAEVEAGADVDAGADLDAPRDAGAEVEANLDAPADVEAADVEAEDALPPVDDGREARPDLQRGPEAAQSDLRRDELRREETERTRPDVDDHDGAIQRESRYLPDAAAQSDFEISDRVRSATANLDIDDSTRSRYRWHNGEWWFKTKSGTWKYHRDGEWRTFDPTTYQAARPGIIYSDGGSSGYAPQSSYSGGYVAPQTYSSGGYYYESRPYTTTRRYGVYRPDYERYDGRYYGGSYGSRVYGDRYYGDGFYGNGYYGGRGYGYQGYNPRNDRYYGVGPYGGRYSIDGDRYRGGVIGSQIGGQIGGRSGAIIGGAIGAEAAD